ncbi:MAG TPA: AMP-binding protein [Nitrospirota bacterium]|nr:AMP-binding protein [Nitrospirota bacterium]
MILGRTLHKIQDVTRAIVNQKKLDSRKWSPQELVKYQHERLSSLIRHAISHSPFYRELYKNVNVENSIKLEDLPVINKVMMMENFDTFVTDSRLKLKELLDHTEKMGKEDALFLDEYRVITTSGSSGFKGVFVWNKTEWCAASAAYFRCGSTLGVKRTIPRFKMAVVAAGSPIHVSYRMSICNDINVVKYKRLEATTSIENLVKTLNSYQPDCLSGYPSILALLANEQNEKRLNIRLRAIGTTGELCTDGMAQKIHEAWGLIPYNLYGLTEAGAFLGSDCSFHQGVHVFEDLFIVEVVDEKNKPVPDGTAGSKFLLTNLFNYTQPVIRYEVSDIINMTSDPCSCGSPFRRIRTIEGRSDDVIYLPNNSGKQVPVHALSFHTPLLAFREIKEYQVIQEVNGIDVFVVLKQGVTSDQIIEPIKTKLKEKIGSLGAICPDIRIQVVLQLDRDSRKMGKLRLVKSNVKTYQQST